MPAAPLISIAPVAPAEGPLLSSLLELYIHDMSAFFPGVTPGPDGRFGYPALPAFLAGEGGRQALLARRGGWGIGHG